MARAVYSDADVFLFDDPLSAVDGHVGRHLFEVCIAGSLRDKTRILVTNHLSCLEQCDRVLLLEKGKIAAIGTFEELCQTEPGFRELTATFGETSEDAEEEVATSGSAAGLELASLEKAPSGETNGSVSKTGALTSAEDRAEGRVDSSVYLRCLAGVRTNACLTRIENGCGADTWRLGAWATACWSSSSSFS